MINRQFIFKGWDYTLERFKWLAREKKYTIRFRLEYYNLVDGKSNFKQLVFVWLQNVGAIFKTIIILARFQFSVKMPQKLPNPIIILVTRNNVYLQTLKPLILNYAIKQANIKVLCPEKHYQFIKEYLGKQVEPYLFQIESIIYEPKLLKRIFDLLIASLVALSDGAWFTFQPIQKGFWVAPAFSRYGLTQSYFGKGLERYFASGAKLIAASDSWMWESLYFISAQKVNAQCYVLQHGIIADISYPIIADQFLTWGKNDFETMLHEYGAAPNEVRIIGSPHFDDVYQKIQIQKTSETQFEKPYLTFLSQPYFNFNVNESRYYQTVLDRFCALAPIAEKYNKQLVIKLHPADKIEYYDQIPSNISITTDELFNILDNTCLAFTVWSTAIFEAVMFGIPALQCEESGMERIRNFSKSKICKHSNSAKGIKDFTMDLLSSKDQYDNHINESKEALNLYFFDYKNHNTLNRIDDLLK